MYGMATKDGGTNQPPPFLTVFGAGIEAANGVYHLTSENTGTLRDCCPYYAMMRDQSDDHEKTFRVYPCGEDEPPMRWLISDPDGKDLYSSNPVLDGSLIPPLRGFWDNSESENGFRPPIIFLGESRFLDWRHEPEQSFADYRIDIIREKEEAEDQTPELITTYHVHSLMIASSSSYFAKLCAGIRQGQSYVEGKNRTSRIVLKSSQAKLFPCLLDHLYAVYSIKGMSSKTRPWCDKVTEFYWMADYFGVTPLLQDLERGWKEEMNLWNFSFYLCPAQEFGVEPIVRAAFELLGEFLGVERFVVDELLRSEEASLVKLLRTGTMTEDWSRKASQIVSRVCSYPRIDLPTFTALTDAALLPHIEAKAVWGLLRKESELVVLPEWCTVSNLQRRCISALATDFANLTDHNCWYDPYGQLRSQSKEFMFALVVELHERCNEEIEADDF
jgi:hypothetical protein